MGIGDWCSEYVEKLLDHSPSVGRQDDAVVRGDKCGQQLEPHSLYRGHRRCGVLTSGPQPRAGQDAIEVPPYDGHFCRNRDEWFATTGEAVTSGICVSQNPVDGERLSPNDKIRRGVQDLVGTQVFLNRLERRHDQDESRQVRSRVSGGTAVSLTMTFDRLLLSDACAVMPIVYSRSLVSFLCHERRQGEAENGQTPWLEGV